MFSKRAVSRLTRARHLPCSPFTGAPQWAPRCGDSSSALVNVSAAALATVFPLFRCRRASAACQEFTTAVSRCAPCSRGNSAEWFHLKSLSVKPPCRSRMALRTAVNNIELPTARSGCTFCAAVQMGGGQAGGAGARPVNRAAGGTRLLANKQTQSATCIAIEITRRQAVAHTCIEPSFLRNLRPGPR